MTSGSQIVTRLRRPVVLFVAIALLFAIWTAAFGRLLAPLMAGHWCGWRDPIPVAPPGAVDLLLQEWGLPLIAVAFVATLATALVVLRGRV